MASTPELRPARAEDLAGVLRIDRETPEAPHWAEVEYAGRVAGEEEGELMRRCLLVAAASETVVGYAAARVVAGEAELETVAVDASARRQGIGRELCRAVMEWSRLHGAEVMDLEVRAASLGPQRLYAELGFMPTGRRRDYYQEPPDDAVMMRVAF
ncbi:GNAT family N-acetyltransferase [Granulicella sp. WH15]|uniref:GNAT family N-acetyltransferase n=1 Tax=Granulicella sp. WH15 TaxID=2602070 RepID=UPI0013A5AA6D|nr:GNAT family N-acetyltransferase [Granulicella sp. WH15]